MSHDKGLHWERASRGSVELRGKVWSVKFSEKATDVNGTVARRRRRERLGTITQFRTQWAAELELDRHLAALRPATLRPGRDVSAAEYCGYFLSVRAAVKRRRTIQSYRRIIEGVLVPALKGRRLADVDVPFIQSIIARYAREKSRTTLQLWMRVILRVLHVAEKDGFSVHHIDARALELPSERRVMDEQRWFERSEVDSILATAPWPAKAIFALEYFGGLRAGEALGLRRKDVLHEARLLRIRQNAVDGELGALKTRDARADIPLLPELAAILTEYVDHHWTENPHDLLFCTSRGNPFDSETVRTRWLAPCLQQLGLKPGGHHAFRHGATALLFDMGWDLPAISRVLRHASVQMTMKYLHGMQDRLKRRLNTLYEDAK